METFFFSHQACTFLVRNGSRLWQSFDKQKRFTGSLSYLNILRCPIFRRKVDDKKASISNFERILLHSSLSPQKYCITKNSKAQCHGLSLNHFAHTTVGPLQAGWSRRGWAGLQAAGWFWFFSGRVSSSLNPWSAWNRFFSWKGQKSNWPSTIHASVLHHFF